MSSSQQQQQQQLSFSNRVVLVTGAGAGLGRQYALYFGRRGAKVVVNDLGGGMHGGDSGSRRAAELVANEIVANGGVAVANFDSVEDGEAVVRTAIDTFGRIDVLVNNAGILRDRSIGNTSDTDWDLVHRVHLRGSFLVTRAAWPHMRKQRFGRVIMTSSAAGIYGNFGQANYSSAKLGLLGLASTLAIEGQKYNILCNTIAPIAGSRLTESVMPQELVQQLKPEYVAPLVLYLCHESCEETGGLFEVGAGWVGRLRWERSRGAILRHSDMSPEAVRDNWERICDFHQADRPSSIQESTANFVQVLQQQQQQQQPQQQQQQKPKSLPDLIGYESQQPSLLEYSSLQVILYALGVGVSTQQSQHLRFLYEGSPEFTALPTFGVVLAFAPTMEFVTSDLGVSIDPTRILHGEQYLEQLQPYPTDCGRVLTTFRIADIVDKGRGAVLVLDAETCLADGGQVICLNQFVVYLGGAGGFGGRRESEKLKPLVAVPDRKPDVTVEEKTSVDQAALYRLSGDRNPLHIDPQFAIMGGLDGPILHGLCTFGIACRQVLAHFCDNDPKQFRAMKVRFTKPIVPGNTIVTEMWRVGDRVHVQCRVKESGEICLSSGYVDLQQQQQQQPGSAAATADAIFKEISDRISANPQLAAGINSVFLWTVAIGGVDRQWTLDLRSQPAKVHEGKPKTKPDCELILSEETFIDLVAGKVNPQKAFMSGKLKLKGNIMLSQKLEKILRDAAKL